MRSVLMSHNQSFYSAQKLVITGGFSTCDSHICSETLQLLHG